MIKSIKPIRIVCNKKEIEVIPWHYADTTTDKSGGALD